MPQTLPLFRRITRHKDKMDQEDLLDASFSSPLPDHLDGEKIDPDTWSFQQALNLWAPPAAALSQSSNSLADQVHSEEEESEAEDEREEDEPTDEEEEEAIFGITPSHRNDLLLAVSEFRAVSGLSEAPLPSCFPNQDAEFEFHMDFGDQETVQVSSGIITFQFSLEERTVRSF